MHIQVFNEVFLAGPINDSNLVKDLMDFLCWFSWMITQNFFPIFWCFAGDYLPKIHLVEDASMMNNQHLLKTGLYVEFYIGHHDRYKISVKKSSMELQKYIPTSGNLNH